MQNLIENPGMRRGFERHVSANHFIEQNAQTPEVCATVEFFAESLFGRHILNRSDEHSFFGFCPCYIICGNFRRNSFGKSEIQNLYLFTFDL